MTKFSFVMTDFSSSVLITGGDVCCDKLDLANLSYLSISVPTEFCSIVIEFYHSIAFIVVTENFFVMIEILSSIIHYVAT